MMVAGGSSQAADIKVLDIGDNFQIKMSGPIESGDTDKLRAAITEHIAFPDGLLIESDAGDITESMAIGHFLRDNMLTVTAGKQCSNTCFLIWAGGVHRKARGPIDARVITADKDKLRAYLTDMEITKEIISKAASSEPAVLTAEMTGANEYSTRYQQWLADQCGTLTDQQDLDRRAIQALESVEASFNAMGMGGSSMYTVSAETQREAARAREFSPQYRDDLQKNYSEISGCHKNAIAVVRAEENST